MHALVPATNRLSVYVINCFSCFSGVWTTSLAFVMMLSILARFAWRCNYVQRA